MAPAYSAFDTAPGEVVSPLSLEVLEALNIDLGDGIQLFGENGVVGVGALGQYANTAEGEVPFASSGAVNADGSIAIGGGGPEDNAYLDLSPLLGAAGLDDLLTQARLELGALSAVATYDEDGESVGDYQIADGTLILQSDVIGDLVGDLTGALGPVSDSVNGIVGEGGAVDSTVGPLLSGLESTLNTVLLGVGTIEDLGVTATLDVDLEAAVESVFAEPITDEDSAVTIDFSTGEISIDLARLVADTQGGDYDGTLNNLPVNTEVLGPDFIQAALDGAIGTTFDQIPALVVNAVTDALNAAELNIALTGEISSLLGTIGTLDVQITGALGDFVGVEGSEDPVVDTSGTTIIGLPVGTLLQPVLELVTDTILPGLVTPISEAITDEGALDTIFRPIVEAANALISPIAELITENLVSVLANVQEEPGTFTHENGFDEDSFTQRAVQIALLPALSTPLAELSIASATVRQGEVAQLEPELVASPDPVETEQELTTEGTGYAPNSTVTVVYTDADGEVIATNEGVEVDENGDFTDSITVPAGTPEGPLTIVATDEEDPTVSAETSVAVIDDDGTDPDGTDPDGTDPDGTDPDGTDPDGTDPDGTDPDGTDPDGTDPDGTDPDGTDPDGTDPDGTDPDGTDPDGTDPDGTDPDGTDPDGTDPDGTDPDGTDPDGTDPDGTDPDGTDPDGTDPDGTDPDGTDPDGTDPDGTDPDGTDPDGTDPDGTDPDGTDPDGTDPDGTDPDGTDPDGTDPDGTDPDGTDPDGTDPDGTDPDGTDPDGTDPDGTDPDGTDPDGTDPDGTDPDGTDPDGTDPDGTDPDGTDPDGTDPDGTDPDGTDPDGTDPDGTDPDGTDPDGTDPDGTDPDGTDPDGTDPDGTDPDGTDPDGTDPDGTDPDGTDPDGTDPDGDPAIDASPDEVSEGDTITVEGDGYEPDETVTIEYQDSDGNTWEQEVQADDEGNFVAEWTVPGGVALGPLVITATGAVSDDPAQDTVDVVAVLSIAIEHETLPRLDTQIGYGSGYEPGTVVHGFMNSAPELDLGTQVADADGNVTFTWQVPSNAELAIHTFQLTADEYEDQSIEFRVVAEAGTGPGAGDGGDGPGSGTSPGGGLPSTGTSALNWLLLALTLGLAGTGGLLWKRRLSSTA